MEMTLTGLVLVFAFLFHCRQEASDNINKKIRQINDNVDETRHDLHEAELSKEECNKKVMICDIRH